MQILSPEPVTDPITALMNAIELTKMIPILQKRIEDLEARSFQCHASGPKEYYSVSEAAEFLSVSEKTVRRLVDRGLLKRSFGIRHIRIFADSLKSYGKMTGLSGD